MAFTGGEIGTVTQCAVAAATGGRYYYLKKPVPASRDSQKSSGAQVLLFHRLLLGQRSRSVQFVILPPVQLNNLVGFFRENRLFKLGGWIAANHTVCFQ